MADDCQAYLVVDAGGVQPTQLRDALRQRPVACVLLKGSRSPGDGLRALVDACHEASTTVLIETDAQLAVDISADGVHLPYPGSAEEAERLYKEARAIVGGDRVVGAEAGLLRHDAMVLAELGADYVAFTGGDRLGMDALLEHVGWWAEMFEVPCVAWGAPDAEVARQLAAAGADFVAAGPASGVTAALDILSGLSKSHG